MIERKIRALVDFKLRNEFGSHSLIKGEVVNCTFKNEDTFLSLIQKGKIELVINKEEQEVEILVIPPVDLPIKDIPADNELYTQLELTGNLDKLDPTPAINETSKANQKEETFENTDSIEEQEVKEEQEVDETNIVPEVEKTKRKQVWDSTNGYYKRRS